ncbi:MAG: hypothetical protein R2731_13930 [Nocardioides sp.]
MGIRAADRHLREQLVQDAVLALERERLLDPDRHGEAVELLDGVAGRLPAWRPAAGCSPRSPGTPVPA